MVQLVDSSLIGEKISIFMMSDSKNTGSAKNVGVVEYADEDIVKISFKVENKKQDVSGVVDSREMEVILRQDRIESIGRVKK